MTTTRQATVYSHTMHPTYTPKQQYLQGSEKVYPIDLVKGFEVRF